MANKDGSDVWDGINFFSDGIIVVFGIKDHQFLDSLRRRANARNVSFRISLRWPINS